MREPFSRASQRIVQVATPAEIYEAPNSRYVADFIGDINIFEGKVVSNTGDAGRPGLVTLDCDGLKVTVEQGCAAVAGKTKLPVAGYRIPLILYAPKLVDAGVVERTVSQMDVAPTLLDLLKVDGDDYFFGRSAFELPPAPERAFVSNYQSLGYLRSNVLTVLSPGRKVETFAVDPSTFETRPIALDRTLADEAIAYYQTAARAFKQGALAAPAYRGS